MNLGQVPVRGLLLLLLLLQGCSYTSERQHPDFDINRRFIERVAILPPTVSVRLKTFTGEDEHMLDKEQALRQYLDKQARKVLVKNGYQVCDMHFDELAETDSELAFQIEQLKNAYAAASKDLYSGETVAADDYKHFRVTVGPIVNRFAELADADALLLIEFAGIVKSEGQMRKEIAANILLGALTGTYAHPVSEVSAVEIALLDANTGDILWTNVKSAASVSGDVLGDALARIPAKTAPAAAGEPAAAPEAESGDREISGE